MGLLLVVKFRIRHYCGCDCCLSVADDRNQRKAMGWKQQVEELTN
jgi:hypothetical protein